MQQFPSKCFLVKISPCMRVVLFFANDFFLFLLHTTVFGNDGKACSIYCTRVYTHVIKRGHFLLCVCAAGKKGACTVYFVPSTRHFPMSFRIEKKAEKRCFVRFYGKEKHAANSFFPKLNKKTLPQWMLQTHWRLSPQNKFEIIFPAQNLFKILLCACTFPVE